MPGRRFATLALLCLTATTALNAAAPPLREQVSLNGTWQVTEEYWAGDPMTLHTRSGNRTVPEYRWQIVGSQDGDPVDDDTFVRWEWGQQTYTYTRTVTVPAGWAGKRVVLEVERANFKPTVSVNGTQVATFLPPYVPFAVDLSDHVTAGADFELTITVQADWVDDTYEDANGFFLWPMGGWSEIGILGDLWLRAYGQVAIEDAFIQTSVRDGTLSVDYELFNDTDATRTVEVAGSVSPAAGGATVTSLTSGSVTLAPGERRTVSVSIPWDDAVLWHPQNPHLYHLQSRLMEGTTEVDRELRRFGFREIWIEGKTFRLNGVRLNLRGDSTAPHGIRFADNEDFFTPDTFDAYLTFLQGVNANVFRHHTYPAAAFMLERCDEVGMLVIDESALRGDTGKYDRNTAILANMRDHWIGPWVRAHRNHPSLIMWSAENEGFLWNITNADMLSLGNRIRDFDTTRPVTYCGDPGVADAIKSMHYPEGYGNSPSGSIYSWASKLDGSRPTAVSEFCTEYKKSDTRSQHTANFWWQGTWSRGLRYVGFADIRPYTLIWAAGATWDEHWYYGYGANPVDEPGAVANLANSYAPVALFDKAYDDLGIAPLKDGVLPTLTEGAQVERTLVLYNDEFVGERIEISVELRNGSTLHAVGSAAFDVTRGEHIDIPVAFQVPDLGGGTLEMVLVTRKGGVERFREVRRFTVADAGFTGPSDATVAITGGIARRRIDIAFPGADPVLLEDPTHVPIELGDVHIFDLLDPIQAHTFTTVAVPAASN